MIANSKADLFDGAIANPLDRDERGNTVTGSVHAFTGTLWDGTKRGNCGDMPSYCSNWSSSTGNGTAGLMGHMDGYWLNSGCSNNCPQSYRLYCVKIS